MSVISLTSSLKLLTLSLPILLWRFRFKLQPFKELQRLLVDIRISPILLGSSKLIALSPKSTRIPKLSSGSTAKGILRRSLGLTNATFLVLLSESSLRLVHLF